jgi:lipopolysaccharide/colanic/teichoic acid biosynthesis glycosyltransferase
VIAEESPASFPAGTVGLATPRPVDRIDEIRQVRPVGGATTRRSPTWLRRLTTWQAASRHPLPVFLDTAITAGAVLVVTDSAPVALVSAATMVAAGLAFGIWKYRTSLETQGVTWYARPLSVALVAVGLTTYASGSGVSGWRAVLAAAVAGAALLATRLVLWLVISSARRKGAGLSGALVIGSERRIEQVMHRMLAFPDAGLRCVATYIPSAGKVVTPEEGRALVRKLLEQRDIEHVICALDQSDEAVFRNFLCFSADRVDCSLMLPLTGMRLGLTRAHLGDLSLVPVRLRRSWGAAAAKRAFDIVTTSILIVCATPLLLAVALAVRLGDHGPSLFKQTRVWRNGETFLIYKFRSMIVNADDLLDEFLPDRGLLFKVQQDPRVTRIGAFLRRLSLDELPQLFNVLRGDMSLVGPRPYIYDPETDARAIIRHLVPPGITGLGQVHHANALTDDDMFDLDVLYVATQSFGSDLLLLLQTIPSVLVRRSPY